MDFKFLFYAVRFKYKNYTKNIIFYVHVQGGAITLSTLNITAIFRDMKIL